MGENEYQPRKTNRLIEILMAQDQNPRSWQFETAGRLSNLNWLAENKDAALKEAMSEVVRLRSVLTDIAEYCSGEDRSLGAVVRLASVRNTAQQALR